MSKLSDGMNKAFDYAEGWKRWALVWVFTMISAFVAFYGYPLVAQWLPFFDSDATHMAVLFSTVSGIVANRELREKYLPR